MIVSKVAANLQFSLKSQIGSAQGRNSEVFIADDHQLDAEIVVKKIPKSPFAKMDEYFGEARRLYEARHPNVVDIRYACEDADCIYLAMPLYSGGSLHSVCEQSGLTVRDIVRFSLDFLQGLHHVHSKSLVHFDVKPSNVLLDASGRACLADFGISRYMGPTGLVTAGPLYFLHWPPEFMLSQELSMAADIYQAGLTIYRMLVGIDSLEAQAGSMSQAEILAAVQAERFPSRDSFPLHIPRTLVQAVRKALAIDPSDRHTTVLDLISSLASTDQRLDWSYESNSAGTSLSWECVREGQLRRVELTDSGSAWQVEASKTNTTTNVKKRQHAFCKVALPWGEAKKLTLQALDALE